MDNPILTLVAVGALFFVISKIDAKVVKTNIDDLPGVPYYLDFPLYLLVFAGLGVLGGAVVFLLWGLVAPPLGLPSIDFLTAVALRLLVTGMFVGLFTPTVKIVGQS